MNPKEMDVLSRSDIEFEVKSEQFNKISNVATCVFCKTIPRSAPIYLITRAVSNLAGKTVCASCNTFDVGAHVRNYVLEALIEDLPTSCKNRSKGCELVDYSPLISYHETICVKREIQCVNRFCTKTFQLSDLRSHLKIDHAVDITKTNFVQKRGSNYFINVEIFQVMFDKAFVRWNVEPFQFEGRSFMIHSELNAVKKCLVIWIQLFGLKSVAKQFEYFLGLADKSLGIYSYGGPVKSLDDDKQDIFQSQDGFSVSYDTVKKFLQNNILTIEIQMKKKC